MAMKRRGKAPKWKVVRRWTRVASPSKGRIVDDIFWDIYLDLSPKINSTRGTIRITVEVRQP